MDEKQNVTATEVWMILNEYTSEVDAAVAKIIASRRSACRKLDILYGRGGDLDEVETSQLLDELSRKIGEIE